MSTGTEAGLRRRRVRLTPVRPVPVEFAGERSGEGPFTLGQLNIYRWLSRTPDHPYALLCVELPVPAMASVGDVAGAVAALVARHETLRTTFVPGERPCQRVAASGVLVLEACSLGEGEWGPAAGPRWPGRWSGGCGIRQIRGGARCGWRWPSLRLTATG